MQLILLRHWSNRHIKSMLTIKNIIIKYTIKILFSLKTINCISLILIMQRCFIKEIGLRIKNLDHTIMIVQLPRVIIGKVPNNALNLGNVEAPECVKGADGALDSTDVKALHSQHRPQDFLIHIDNILDILFLFKKY